MRWEWDEKIKQRRRQKTRRHQIIKLPNNQLAALTTETTTTTTTTTTFDLGGSWITMRCKDDLPFFWFNELFL